MRFDSVGQRAGIDGLRHELRRKIDAEHFFERKRELDRAGRVESHH
jgi:hypothetical protein